MSNDVDISEVSLLMDFPKEVINNLLKDHTTQQNIYWATDSYADYGDGFSFYDPITIDKITGEYNKTIIPRAVKSREVQAKRVKDKAEVFTPSWVCNIQNNLIDEAWFGRPNVFNKPDPENPHRWIDNTEPIVFPEGKTWKDYIVDVRLEITCGEAPYLVSRYDTVSGEPIEVSHRIGLLDRKLRVISENVHTSKEWINWAKVAYSTTYGFEWQGDSLLLAREALLFTFRDYYIDKFGETKFNYIRARVTPILSYIISWNIWQMDGLTYGLPGYDKQLNEREEREKKYQEDYKKYKATIDTPLLFSDCELEMPEELPERQSNEKYCEIKNFAGVIDISCKSVDSKIFTSKDVPMCVFKDLVKARTITK